MSKSNRDLVAQIRVTARKAARSGAQRALKQALKQSAKRTRFVKEAANNGGDISAEQMRRAVTAVRQANDVRLIGEVEKLDRAARILHLQKALEVATDPAHRAAIGQQLTYERLRKAATESDQAARLVKAFGNHGAPSDSSMAATAAGRGLGAPGARSARDQIVELAEQLRRSDDPLERDRLSYELTKARLVAAHESGAI